MKMLSLAIARFSADGSHSQNRPRAKVRTNALDKSIHAEYRAAAADSDHENIENRALDGARGRSAQQQFELIDRYLHSSASRAMRGSLRYMS